MNGGGNKTLVLAAMIFAVAMTFIDQTIVSIAVPELQKDLGLSATGVQWVINGYLLALAAMFAFGGRIADIAGHRRMVLTGIVIFAGSSALCGATPDTSIAEAWLIFFRVIQGVGAAIMFPAALAIVVSAYPVNERGKALAAFFGITGGLTAIGPLAGGYLSEWTWRAIFWVNIPVALIAIFLTLRAKPDDTRRPAPLDLRGAILIAAGMGLAVLGLQQSSTWGWDDPATWGTIVVGLALLAAFVKVELATPQPLIQLRIFASRAFAADCAVLFLLSIAFLPMFLFASEYAQLSLGEDPSNAGLYLLTFFGGFAVASQFGGRILDQRGAVPRWSPAARSPRSATSSGPANSPTSTSTPSGTGWSSPAPAPAWCSARRAPTRSTAPRRPATARSPGSPRRCATSAAASGSRCSGRS